MTKDFYDNVNFSKLLGEVGSEVLLNIHKQNTVYLEGSRQVSIKREEIILPQCDYTESIINQTGKLWDSFYEGIQYHEKYNKERTWSSGLINANTVLEKAKNQPACQPLIINTLATPYTYVGNALKNLKRNSALDSYRDDVIRGLLDLQH